MYTPKLNELLGAGLDGIVFLDVINNINYIYFES